MKIENPGHDSRNGPRHKDVSFESSDVETKVIYWYLAGLAFAVIATFFVCIFIERAAMNYSLQQETEMPPSRAEAAGSFSDLPPEPRLQGIQGHDNNAPEDLREMLQKDNQANATGQWLDKKSGIAQIPVSEAMKILAEKGTAGGVTVPEQKKPEAKNGESKKVQPKR